MKKTYLFIAALFVAIAISAEQMPKDYYNAINGKKDAELKTALSQIIYPVDWSTMTQTSSKPNYIVAEYKAGNRCKYGTRGINEKHDHLYTWDGFWYTDTQDDGSVWDMYSPYTYYMAPDSLGAISIPDQEIEHCFPKSWWGGGSSNVNDAYQDLHHLNPANGAANGQKKNYPPGVVTSSENVINALFKIGKNSEYGSFTVYEPCDEYKGDFAREYFYIATAYENFVWDDKAKDYLDNSSYLEFKPWLQKVLIEWHRMDPVSEKEINRNNRVCDIQHNRNPYIDYPELAEYIWGNKANTTVDLSQLTFTGSESYKLPVETLVSRTLPATDITATGFTANWKDAGKSSYQLDVFTKQTTGHNDTILNKPYFHQDSVKNEPHFSTSGTITTNGAGRTSITFSTSLVLTVSGLTIADNSRIVIRAMAPVKTANTEGAQMKVTADGNVIANQDLTRNETYYSFDLPTGTNKIVIQSGNNKAFNVQQLFVITGDEKTTFTSLAGFPKSVTGTSFAVENTMSEDVTLYYTITPKDLKTSVPMAVIYKDIPDPDPDPDPDPQQSIHNTEDINPFPAQKVLEKGRVIIIRDGIKYSILGERL